MHILGVMRRFGFKRGIMALGAGMGLFAAIFWWAYLRDEAPPDESDFRRSAPVIPITENGLVLLARLPVDPLNFERFADQRGLDVTDFPPWSANTGKGGAAVDDFLAQAGPTLARLDEMLALPEFATTESPGGFSPHARPLHLVGETLRLAIVRRRETGALQRALDDLLRLRRLQQRMSGPWVLGVSASTSFILQRSAQVQSRELLNDPRLAPATRDALARSVPRSTDWGLDFDNFLLREYSFLDALLKYAEQEDVFSERRLDGSKRAESAQGQVWVAWLRLNYLPNTTRHMVVEKARQVREAGGRPYREIQQALDGAVMPAAGLKVD